MVFRSLETLWRDLRYSLRVLRRDLSFTAVALLSLALGIGAVTAIFSVVYGVLISPYPYAKPNEIWAPDIQSAKAGQRFGRALTQAEFLEMSRLPAVSSAMATSWDNVLLSGDRTPESFTAILLSPNAFEFLGVPAEIGRTFGPGDIRSDGQPEPVMVLSHVLWQRLFEGDANCLGKTLVLNGVPHTIIGVMPPRFGWYTGEGFWLPMGRTGAEERPVNPIIRLRAGADKNVAEQQLTALLKRMASERPKDFPKDGVRAVLTNYMDMTVSSGEMRSSLRLLFATVGFLLLIACANVANLQLARTTARTREIAVRQSIGASRSRLIRQLLTESVTLSLAGGALGVLLAVAATKGIVAVIPSFYTPNEARITVNLYALLFSAGASVLTGILFGLAPAIQASRPRLAEALKDAARGTGHGGVQKKMRNVLVIAEVALAVILLVGSSMAIRGFLALQQLDTGFHAERVLMVGLPLQPKKYVTVEQRNQFAEELTRRVESLPGVEGVAVGNGGLPFGGPQSPFVIEGRAPTDAERVTVSLISSGYMKTMGIPLVRGRELTAGEVAHGDAVALINEAAAKLFGSGDPIGRRVKLGLLESTGRSGPPVRTGTSPWVTVVGIAKDTRNRGLRQATAPSVYIPYTSIAPPFRVLAVRTQGTPTSLLNAVRGEVLAMDKEQPLGRPITVEEVLGFETVQPRFNMALFSTFAFLGLALAAAGIYSVISYHVTRRTHEIGVRVALGARTSAVIGLVLRMGASLVVSGILLGLAGSFALVRILKTEVFGVGSMDYFGTAAVVTVLSIAALAACYIPARRAARLDPIKALRHD